MRMAFHIWPEEILQHTYSHLALSIGLPVKCSAELKIRFQEFKQLGPKLACKSQISVRDNNLWHSMIAKHCVNE